MNAVIWILVFIGVIGAILWYSAKLGKKQDQDALKESAVCAEACECRETEIAEEAVKIELAMEPKVSKPIAKKKAKISTKKKPAKKVKKIDEVIAELTSEKFSLQPVEPKQRKPKSKKPSV